MSAGRDFTSICESEPSMEVSASADAMMEILKEDTCNDTYGRVRMYQALTLKQPENVDIPSERTVYRIMEEIGISHHPRRKPNGITKADGKPESQMIS